MPTEKTYRAPHLQRKERSCLRCDRMFKSEGPHHRLCSPCREYLGEYSPEECEYRLRLDRPHSDKA
jgi:hypothetical protein